MAKLVRKVGDIDPARNLFVRGNDLCVGSSAAPAGTATFQIARAKLFYKEHLNAVVVVNLCPQRAHLGLGNALVGAVDIVDRLPVAPREGDIDLAPMLVRSGTAEVKARAGVRVLKRRHNANAERFDKAFAVPRTHRLDAKVLLTLKERQWGDLEILRQFDRDQPPLRNEVEVDILRSRGDSGLHLGRGRIKLEHTAHLAFK
mmetsp:Transcript_17957/g.26591  ORF Transcript_17957/g.26591 Transcript_17957/m.26591 type:complete len:202 (+) Transcript_17957:295-900(+)